MKNPSVRLFLCVGVFAFLVSGCSALQMHADSLGRELRSAGVSSSQVKLPSGRMRVWRGGSGAPIVFLHGFGANAPDTWTKQLKAFALRFTVYAPDLYWFGKSFPRSGKGMITPEEQAGAVIEMMNRFRLRRVHLVGVSYGGYVAMEMVLRYPNRVNRLVLVDAAGIRPTSRERSAIRRHFAYSKGDLQKMLIPKNVKHLRKFFGKIFYKAPWIPEFVYREMLEVKYWRYKSIKTQMVSYLGRRFLPLSRLREISHKTLVVWGRYDRLLLPSLGKRMARAIPHAKLVLVDKAGHAPMLERAVLFNRLLRRFFRPSSLAMKAQR